MTDSLKPTNRRRRRIVVTITVLALGLGWSFWPRADQRFVGTWEVPRGLFQVKASEYLFHSNGWGRRIEQPPAFSGDRVHENNFRWWLEDDWLVLELNNLTGRERLFAQAQTAIAPLFGLAPKLSRERLRVHAISGDSLTMDVPTTYRTFILVGVLKPTTLTRVRK
jgi:hypothetical protein